MSEPMQPHKEGGMKQPPQTPPGSDQSQIGDGQDRGDALYDKDRSGGGGGMIGEGESED
jgi:hypothetical protein